MNFFRELFTGERQPAIDDGRIEAIANAGLEDADFVKSDGSDNLGAVLASAGNQPIVAPARPHMVYTNGGRTLDSDEI